MKSNPDQLDLLEAMTEARDRLQKAIEAEEARRFKLEAAQARAALEEATVLCVNALSLIQKGKFHHSLDGQVKAIKDGLRSVAAYTLAKGA